MNHTMDHDGHSGHEMMNISCDGSLDKMKGGTWKGHVGPGILFIIWGSWWVYSVLSYIIWSSKHHRHCHSFKTFISKSWYPMPSHWFYYTEPVLKIVLPLLYVSVELYFDHPDGFQYLRCPEGTLYEHRFSLSHINNWQHAATYPPIVLSGIIDLVSTRVPLPRGTGHVFLAFAFAVQAFVMGTHEKHRPQDQMVHWLLFLSMLLCFTFILLELHTALKNPLPALGRGAAAIFLGAWLYCIGKIEFEHLPQWSEDYPGGTMLAPVYFITVALLVLCAVTVFGLGMAALSALNLMPRASLPLLEDDDELDALSKYDENGFRNTSGRGLGNIGNGGYLELSRRDTAQHAQQHYGEETKLLPALSLRRKADEVFGTDSAQRSGAASPRSSSTRDLV